MLKGLRGRWQLRGLLRETRAIRLALQEMARAQAQLATAVTAAVQAAYPQTRLSVEEQAVEPEVTVSFYNPEITPVLEEIADRLTVARGRVPTEEEVLAEYEALTQQQPPMH